MDNSLKGRLPWTGVQYHFAWAIVVMAIILQVTTNFLSQAFGLLIVTLRDNFQWTLTAITLAYFFRWVVFGVLSPVAGWAGDRYGARRVLMFAAVLYIGGMLLLSTVARPWHLYIYYSVILGAAQALFSVNIPTTVAVWFRSKLGMAVGIQHSAGGMGASVMAPLLALLLLKAGWQTTFWIIPGVGGLIIFSVLFLFRSDPADKGVKPYGVRGDTTPTGVAMDKGMARLRTRVFMQHVRRTRAFWNLILIHYAGCVGHSIVMVGAVFFATSRGLSLEAAAWIISFYSLFSVCSRFATPILADRWGAKRAMAMAFFVQGVTVTLLFWTQEAWQFYVFAALFGIGLGGEMTAFLVANRQYYGMGPVRTVYGFQNLGSGLGMALGGLLGSIIFDRFGSFDLAWAISIGASLTGVVLILLLESPSRVLVRGWENSLPAEARSAAEATTP